MNERQSLKGPPPQLLQNCGRIVSRYVGDGGRPDKRDGYVHECSLHPTGDILYRIETTGERNWGPDPQSITEYCVECGASATRPF